MNWKELFGIRDTGTLDAPKANELRTQVPAEGRIDLVACEALFASRRKRLQVRHPIDWTLPLPLPNSEMGLFTVNYRLGDPAIVFSVVIPERYGENGLNDVARTAQQTLFSGAEMDEVKRFNENGCFACGYVVNERGVFK